MLLVLRINQVVVLVAAFVGWVFSEYKFLLDPAHEWMWVIDATIIPWVAYFLIWLCDWTRKLVLRETGGQL